MDDKSAVDVPEEKKSFVAREILRLMDKNGDRLVEKDEFMLYIAAGNTLPDFGLGPGHHGDDEYEYEIHHWEK